VNLHTCHFSVNPDSEIYVKSKRTLSLPVNFKVSFSPWQHWLVPEQRQCFCV